VTFLENDNETSRVRGALRIFRAGLKIKKKSFHEGPAAGRKKGRNEGNDGSFREVVKAPRQLQVEKEENHDYAEVGC